MKEVVDSNDNIRIDSYLSKKLGFSRSKIQKLIKEEKILVNEKYVNSSYKVMLNDVIDITSELTEKKEIKGEDIKVNIIYEDADLLVIDKESGMVVHPAPGNYEHTLVNALIGKYELSSDESRPGIVHRIDKDTSGLMLVAKNDFTCEKLSQMIKDKVVERYYLALVDGVIRNNSGTIDAPIGRNPKYREKMMVTDINSKNAVTHFRVVDRFLEHTLIECKLDTGRTHQIRVHLAYIGYPIVNDSVYNKKSGNDFGQLLHSCKIKFPHPRTGEILDFESPLPIQFKEIMDNITKKNN